jgi:hypothetical protein
MRIKGYRVLIIILISAFSLGFIVLKPAFNYISGYLSKSEQVKANILIVEGWLPDYAINMSYKEFKNNKYDYVITTGLKTPQDYFGLYSNGFLIFYTKNKFSGNSKYGQHLIEVDAYSELEGENCAHINLFVNDSLIVDYLTDKQKRKYPIKWTGSLSDIDSIMVEFTNDNYGDFGDRNLFIKEIIVDHNIIIPFQNNTIYDVGDLDGKYRVVNNFYSDAELARNSLLSIGIDSSQIITIPGERVRINRTLTSALAFRDWLKTSKIDIKGINIISMGTHARRTWMTYNKILKEKYDIGIISLPDNISKNSSLRKTFRTIRETLGIIYYWIILIPY